MAKKKKSKKHSEFSKPSGLPIGRFIIIGLIASAGYGIYSPSEIPHPAIQSHAILVRSKINSLLANQSASNSASIKPNIDNGISQIAQKLPEKIPTGAILGEEDIYVEQVLEDVTSTVKQLPKDQLIKLKQQFCTDVIQAALEAANP